MSGSSINSTGVTPYEAAVGILRRLREAGHVAYLAGGCVRDALLGMEPKDYDVATDARPEVVRKLFRRSRYVGEAFGVCLVSVGDVQVEVATFRVEWGYSDGRRPDRVEFTDAEHDARRRDFTINGLFADPLDDGEGAQPQARIGRVIDYVGGVEDLKKGVVRAIGEADERFAEDYLRMLRAVRFAARPGFEIEGKTAAAIRAVGKYLGGISRERIGGEVRAMLSHAKPQAWARAVQLLGELGLDGVVLREDHREAGAGVLERVEPGPVGETGEGPTLYATKLAAWAVDRYVSGGDVDVVARWFEESGGRVVERWRGALCLSNEDRDALKGVLLLVARAAGWETLGVAGRKRLLAERYWGQALLLLRAIGDERVAAIERDAVALAASPGGIAPAPLVTGEDLIALGLTPGPVFGKLLEAVYDEQLEGRMVTKGEAVAWVRGATGRGE